MGLSKFLILLYILCEIRLEITWQMHKAHRACDTGQNLDVGGLVGRVRIYLGQFIEIPVCPWELEGLGGMLGMLH